MVEAITRTPQPINEPVLNFAPGSPEIAQITAAIADIRSGVHELPMVIDGKRRMGAQTFEVREPHETARLLGVASHATVQDASDAIDAALAAAPAWRDLPFDARAAIFLKAADLLAGPWRFKFLAGTMLGQSKTVYQAEIDASCELIDFLRFNVSFARGILEQQPISGAGVWNRTDHRPLEASSTPSRRSTSQRLPATCRLPLH